MGDMADDLYMEMEIAEYQQEQREQMRVLKAKKIFVDYMCGILKWETKDFGDVFVTKMTDDHIRHTIHMLERQANNDSSDVLRDRWIEIFNIEQIRRTV